MRLQRVFIALPALVLVFATVAPASATQAAQGGRAGGAAQPPPVISPEGDAHRRIAFRSNAPQAQRVRLSASDIPGLGQTAVFVKNDAGVWELTVGPIDPGSYRYNINVDG